MTPRVSRDFPLGKELVIMSCEAEWLKQLSPRNSQGFFQQVRVVKAGRKEQLNNFSLENILLWKLKVYGNTALFIKFSVKESWKDAQTKWNITFQIDFRIAYLCYLK